jgi:cytochrome P450
VSAASRNSLPPGPSAPRPAQVAAWVARPLAFMERCQRRYGDVFTMRVENGKTWVFFSDPDAVKEIFTGDPRVFHAGEGNVILLPILGARSVLLLDEAAHLEQRKLMLPPFHGERMQRYGELMSNNTDRAPRIGSRMTLPSPAWNTRESPVKISFTASGWEKNTQVFPISTLIVKTSP